MAKYSDPKGENADKKNQPPKMAQQKSAESQTKREEGIKKPTKPVDGKKLGAMLRSK